MTTLTKTETVDIAVIANRKRIVLDMQDADGDGFTLLIRPDGSLQFVPWLDGKPASIPELFAQLETVRGNLPTTAR